MSQRIYELVIRKFVKKKSSFKWKLTLRSAQNFAHVTTAELSQFVQTCELIGSLE